MVLIKKENLAPSSILVVDDDRIALMTLEARLQSQGYTVITAISGKSACEIIEKEHKVIDAILLDRMMPEMDGLQVIEWLKKQQNLTKIPIIMQTGSDRPDQIKEGIDAGVFYYLTKPIAEEVLRSVVSSAVKESKQKKVLRSELSSHRSSFKLMNRAVFYVQTISEAENISCFVANCFPDPEAVLPGVAELIVNAVEHGNLSISYEEKTALLLSGGWREEVDKRAQLPENIKKRVEIDFEKEGNKYVIKISDQGKGFFWQKYMGADPSRALESHGRGIARVNMIFSKLEYNKEGNQVLATIDSTLKSTVDW
jgi:two-component system cell cycle response regulator